MAMYTMTNERKIIKDYIEIWELFEGDGIPVNELDILESFVKGELSKLDGVIGTPHVTLMSGKRFDWQPTPVIEYERFEKDYEYKKRVAEEESKRIAEEVSKRAEEQRERAMLEELKKKYEGNKQ